MDCGDRWRVGFHGGEASHVNSIIGRIMLRFRPIMPKPASGDPPACASQQANKRLMVKTKRSKRKYVRVCKNNPTSKRKEKTSSKQHEPVLTLQLMPEKDAQDHMKSYVYDGFCEDRSIPMWLKFRNPTTVSSMGDGVEQDQRATFKGRMVMIETIVTVECITITETCIEEQGLGCTDDERMRNLENETCPCFVSDYSHRVKFVNNAFKKFVSFNVNKEEDETAAEVLICLVVKENLPIMYYSAFSCRVKLQYSNKKCSKMVPCDVWRMEFGGFAWKLDVKAALSLGL